MSHSRWHRGVAVTDPSVAASAEADLAEVAIVCADTRAPVPGASVWWWPKPAVLDGDASFESLLRQSAAEDQAQAARQVAADQNGRVWVPGVAQGIFVAAASAGLWGYASFDADRREPATVLLAPDADVRVQVVDRTGAPVVRATVALRERRLTTTIDHLTARTKEDGIAVLRHAGWFVRAAPDRQGLVVALRGLLDPPLERRLDPDALPDDVVRLVVGPTGSCEVAVEDASGQPVGGPIDARLRFADGNAPGALAGRAQCAETLVSRTGATVVFEHVALGHALAVTVTREGSDACLEARGLGPSRPGERVRLCVRAGVESAILRGRLLDAQGTPAGDRAVRARLEAVGGDQSFEGSWSLRTASDGRFCVDSAPLPEAANGIVLAVCGLSAHGAELAIARRPLPRELPVGSYDLGDFTLIDTPVAVAGIVVDGEGNRIAGATVTPSIPAPTTEAGQRTPWLKCWLPPARSDRSGRFEIRGETASDAISLLAQKQGLVGDPVVVPAAARGVRLVLSAAGSIEGTVLLAPSLLGALVLVHAAKDSSTPISGARPSASPAVVGRDGSFSLGGLQTGTYSIRVVYAANATEIARVESVPARAGSTTRDPRLDPLDLRRTHHLIGLQLVDQLGQPVAHGRAFTRPSGEDDAKWVFCTEEKGWLQLISDGRPVDVAISAPGFLRTEIEGVTSSRRVTLRRAVRLRLELAGGLLIPEPALRLGAELRPLRPSRSPGSGDCTAAYFDASGVLTCETSLTGDLRLEIFVTGRDPRLPARVYLQMNPTAVIAPADHAGEQVFPIELDPARLAAAARSFREAASSTER